MTDWLLPAPQYLAQLAEKMRGPSWAYEDTRAALIALSQAGWDTRRIYREVFQALQDPDATPADLRVAARRPNAPFVPGQGQGGLPPEIRQALEEAVQHANAVTEQQQAKARQRAELPREDPAGAA